MGQSHKENFAIRLSPEANVPNRILKESITTSASLANLTAEAERHFYRLLVQADDYGCFQAHSAIMRAKGYALLLDVVSSAQVEQWTYALVRENIIHLYQAGGKPYGHFVTWEQHQQVRAKRRKYPEPACDITCKQMISSEINSKHLQPDVLGIQSLSLSESLSLSLSESEADSSTPLSSSRKKMTFPLKEDTPATKKSKRTKPTFTTLEKPQDLLALFSEDELTEAIRLFPKLDLEWEAGKCLDWHNARGGSANFKLAFKNWLGKAKPSGDNHQNLTGSLDPDKFIKGKYGHLVQR